MAFWRAWKVERKRRLVAVWHRRAGKDEIMLHGTAGEVLRHRGNYWHMLPEYAQARKAIWTAVNPHTGIRRIDEAFPLEIRARTNEQEMFIEFVNGSTWQVVGSDRFDSLVGSAPRGIVFSEWALANPLAFAYLLPILEENGGWCAFIYTPRGKNHGYSTYQTALKDKDWFAERLTIRDTGMIPEDRVEKQRRTYHDLYGEDAGDAMIEQEFYCSFEAPVPGAYYAKQIKEAERAGRICEVKAYPDLPVHLAWDLGISDATAVWAWQVWPDRSINIIDYHEKAGLSLEQHFAILNAKPWAQMGVDVHDWLPHDARAKELIAGRTRVETFMRCGRKPHIVANHKVDDGINAVRRLLPQCKFDAVNCEKGLEMLRSYHSVFDEKKRVWSTLPYHDFSSHGADAMRYLAMSVGTLRKDVQPEEERRVVGRHTAPQGMTFGDLVKAQRQGEARGRI